MALETLRFKTSGFSLAPSRLPKVTGGPSPGCARDNTILLYAVIVTTLSFRVSGTAHRCSTRRVPDVSCAPESGWEGRPKSNNAVNPGPWPGLTWYYRPVSAGSSVDEVQMMHKASKGNCICGFRRNRRERRYKYHGDSRFGPLKAEPWVLEFHERLERSPWEEGATATLHAARGVWLSVPLAFHSNGRLGVLPCKRAIKPPKLWR